MSIKIKARIYPYYSHYIKHLSVKNGEVEILLSVGSNVIDLIAKVGIPLNEVQLVFINGRGKNLTQVLLDGDEVGLFPHLGGG